MGMRKYKRAIAKARLEAMGIKRSKLGSGIMPRGNRLRKKMLYAHGRRELAKMREEKPAVWVRVTTGNLAKEAEQAQVIAGRRRVRLRETAKLLKKRKVRKVTAPAT